MDAQSDTSRYFTQNEISEKNNSFHDARTPVTTAQKGYIRRYLLVLPRTLLLQMRSQLSFSNEMILTWGGTTRERCGRNLSLLKSSRCWGEKKKTADRAIFVIHVVFVDV